MPSVDFHAAIDSFQIKKGVVKMVLLAESKAGLLEALRTMTETTKGVDVTIIDPQLRLDLYPGRDGHTYPMSDAAGRPTGSDSGTLPVPGTEPASGGGGGEADDDPEAVAAGLVPAASEDEAGPEDDGDGDDAGEGEEGDWRPPEEERADPEAEGEAEPEAAPVASSNGRRRSRAAS